MKNLIRSGFLSKNIPYYFILILLAISTIVEESIFTFRGLDRSIVLLWGMPIFAIHVVKVVLRTKSIQLTISDFLLAIISIYVVITYKVNVDNDFSLRFIQFTSLIAIYVSLNSHRVADFAKLISLFPYILLILCMHGIFQNWDILPRNSFYFEVTGSFSNPNSYAGFMGFLLVMSLPDFLKKLGSLKFWELIIRVIIMLIAFYLIISVQSRATLIGVIISGLFFCRGFLFLKSFYSKLLLCSIIILISIGCIFLYQLKHDSSKGRLLIWHNALEMIKEKPLTGYGFDQFKNVYMKFQGEYFSNQVPEESKYYLIAGSTRNCFNEALLITCEGGLIYLFLVLVFLLLLTTKLYIYSKGKAHNILFEIAFGGSLFYLVFGMFSYPSSNIPMRLLLILCLSILRNLFKIYKFRLSTIARHIIVASGLLIIINTAINAYGLTVKRNEYNSISYLEGEKKDEKFEAIIDFFDNYSPLLLERSIYNIKRENYDRALTDLRKAEKHGSNYQLHITLGDCYYMQKKYSEAIKSFKKAYYMIPSMNYPKYMIAKGYFALNDTEDFKYWASKVLHDSVKVESSEIERMREDLLFWDRSLTTQ